MRSQAALWLAFASCALATPGVFLEQRHYCADSCYAQVSKNQALGTKSRPGCQQFFEKTVSPCTSTSTYPCGPSLTTKTVKKTLTTDTTTTTYTTLLPRAVVTPKCTPITKSSTVVPTYFSSCKNVGSYSSACECLQAQHSTTTIVAKTTTVPPTTCKTSTSLTTTTVNTVYSATQIATATKAFPVCDQQITAYKEDGSSKRYKMKYHGNKKTTNPDADRWNNDPDHPVIIDYLNDSVSDCDVIQECAIKTLRDDDEYFMFDLHRTDADGWICIQYYQGTGDSSNFDLDAPDVTKAYGYQIDYYS